MDDSLVHKVEAFISENLLRRILKSICFNPLSFSFALI